MSGVRPSDRTVWAVGIALSMFLAGACMWHGGTDDWISCVGFGLFAGLTAWITLRDYKRVRGPNA